MTDKSKAKPKYQLPEKPSILSYSSWKVVPYQDEPEEIIDYVLDLINQADEEAGELTQFCIYSFSNEKDSKGHIMISVGDGIVIK